MELECKYCKSIVIDLCKFNKPVVQENLFKHVNLDFQENKSYYREAKFPMLLYIYTIEILDYSNFE